MLSPQQLGLIAESMNAMKWQHDAVVSYDLLSDALHWSDEIPPLGSHRPKDYWCLRCLLRYRTTLILGQPDREFEEYWIVGKEAFPEWAGFYPSRCEPDQELAALYRQRESEGMESLKGK